MDTCRIKDMRKRWARLMGRLRIEFGDTAFKIWLKPISIKDFTAGVLTLSAPTQFLQQWIEKQYLKRIEELWKIELDTVKKVMVVHTAPIFANDEPDTPILHPRKTDGGNSKFTFNTFFVNETNELPFTAAKRLARLDNIFNPLFFFGGVGLGKTHLMQAIATDIRENHPIKNVMYLSAEDFMFRFIHALRNKDTIAFKQELRSVDVLLVDDIQFIAGKVTTQEEFFHTFNSLMDKKCQIVLSADRYPGNLQGMDERLKSRMSWGMVAEFRKTNYALRRGILQSKIRHLKVDIHEEILDFLALKITSNARELEGALNRLIAYVSLSGKTMTLSMVPKILHDVLNVNARTVTIEDIQSLVASHYSIKVVDMRSKCRSRDVARPRQLAIYLAKKLTQASFPDIGRKFGGRDHTTVIYAVRRVEQLMQHDQQLLRDMRLLSVQLNDRR